MLEVLRSVATTGGEKVAMLTVVNACALNDPVYATQEVAGQY